MEATDLDGLIALAEAERLHKEVLPLIVFMTRGIPTLLAYGKRFMARRLGLPVGLYVDLAVGVRADSFDAWNDQDFIVSAIEVGAPPDLLNTAGQKWGLAGFNPINLVERGCEPRKLPYTKGDLDDLRALGYLDDGH